MLIPEVEVKHHIDTKNRRKDEIIAGDTSKSNCIDLMDHEEISSSNAQSEEDNFRNPTCSNHLTNGECKTSTLETKIKLLGNPNGMKTTHLIQETTCND